ncbi:PREDICTED: uncharacterized protein LOC104606154 isoform X1 [Nelumbo nucifera]|uniref:Uncharacterized protein LOC104606154 isoform X1 n=1 Tax=Nelumbo nucifera TaxID=4432 RepID=A0A1U8AP00_NELNU|nr:PREDICTED: uncharacterized protein LOC104606154 isoform X1 [Nelumbo nucifera]
MGKYSLCFKFTLVLSLSLAVSSTSSLPFLRRTHSSSPFSIKVSSSPPKASASDLLSLLGSREQASAINPEVARELRSCLKFLVPFSPILAENKFERFSSGTTYLHTGVKDDQRKLSKTISCLDRTDEDGLIWWPPTSMMELARIAVDSGGDPAAIHRALDPTMLPVPDVEGSELDQCQLTRTPYGRRFIDEELNSYLAFLFEIIAARGPSVGLNVSLDRYDLFHGHLFLATDTGRLGILFHAKEYPAYDTEVFPYNMGYCQIGSNVAYDDSINLRNILWLAPLPSNSTKAWLAPGVLVVLDASPRGVIYKDLIPEYVKFVRTIYEDDFGEVAVDVNYLNIGDSIADYKIFIC